MINDNVLGILAMPFYVVFLAQQQHPMDFPRFFLFSIFLTDMSSDSGIFFMQTQYAACIEAQRIHASDVLHNLMTTTACRDSA